MKRKISLLCDVPVEACVSAVDSDTIYAIPIALHEEGLDDIVCRILRLDGPEHPIDISGWEKLLERIGSPNDTVRIGIIGKYVNLPDAYLSVIEALRHAGFAHGIKVEVELVQAEEVTGMLAATLDHLDAMVIPGGFGERGIEGKIAAAGFAREHEIPCLGLCLGLHTMVVEFARNVADMENANTTEVDVRTPYPVIALMDDQVDITNKGGTMRLGAWEARLRPGSQVADLYGDVVASDVTGTASRSTRAFAAASRRPDSSAPESP